MTSRDVVPKDGDYDLTPLLHGREVTHLVIDGNLRLQFLEGETSENDLELTIEEPFRIRKGDNEWECQPGSRPPNLAKALELLWQTVDAGTAFQNGTLEVIFADGTLLSVRPNPQYEAWGIRGLGKNKQMSWLGSRAGGGLG